MPIMYSEDTPFADFKQEKTRRVGIYARGVDVARYKDIDAIILRPVLDQGALGPAIEIPFKAVPEVVEEMYEYANAPRPVVAFDKALPTKRRELTQEEYSRLMDLVGACQEYAETGEETRSLWLKALQAVLNLELE